MKIDGRRYTRYPMDTKVRAVAGAKTFDAQLKDVSASGAAIAVAPQEMALFENNQFVDLHMEGVGQRRGNIVRSLPGGYALEFDEDEREKERIADELEEFHRNLRQDEY